MYADSAAATGCPALPMVQRFVEVAAQASPGTLVRESSALACTVIVLRLLERPAVRMVQRFVEVATQAST